MQTSSAELKSGSGNYENRQFLEEQLITYIGNKRSLLKFIGQVIDRVKTRIDKQKLNIFDAFSGSGVVARYLKKDADRLIVNDLENYSYIVNLCYLSNKSDISISKLKSIYQKIISILESENLQSGFISELYSPEDDSKIGEGERVFYSNRNARYIDTARQQIEGIDPKLRHFFIAPLLSEASIHANTSGVFKGFYKDSSTGIGNFGGNNGYALKRILGEIHLPFPIFSNFECDVEVHEGDTNELAESIRNIDVTYIDPPYNQHPYGSNYFMLNLIAKNIRPNAISKVSGIPSNWNRSNYNKTRRAYDSFENLVEKLDSKFLLISFNSEGFISKEEMVKLLRSLGKTDLWEISYNTFRGSRNLNGREKYVTEYLYLVEKNA